MSRITRRGTENKAEDILSLYCCSIFWNSRTLSAVHTSASKSKKRCSATGKESSERSDRDDLRSKMAFLLRVLGHFEDRDNYWVEKFVLIFNICKVSG